MSGITGLIHPVVCVPDLDRALSFYGDALGGQVVYRWEHDPATLQDLTGLENPVARAVMVSFADGSELELCEFERPRGLSHVAKQWFDAGISFLTFRVTDIGAVVRRLSTMGISFNGAIVTQQLSAEHAARVVYCFAPEGTTVTLVELPPQWTSLGRQVIDRRAS